MEMKLLEGEQVVLEDSHFSSSRKVTLTNKRLLVQKKKGLFYSYWMIDEEFPLETIDEAYVETDSFSAIGSLQLKLKNGESIRLPVSPDGGALLGTLGAADWVTDSALKIKTVNDRWVNAINNQLIKRQIKQLTNRGNKCPNCGKEIPQGDFGFCPFCGTSLKP